MLRLIFIVLFLILVGLFSIIALPIEWIVGKINPDAKTKSSLAIVRAIFKIILFICGTKTTIIGLENIPKDEPVLFVGNHRGFFDIIISYSLMKRPTGYVAKKEIAKVPILKHWMLNLKCLFLDRENPKEGLKTILTGIDYLKNGTSVVIFPEGTRNEGDGVLEFHQGSFKLADKSGVKIIPMVSNNTDAIFENQMPLIRKAHTVLEFGQPIDMASMDREDKKKIAQITHDIVLKMYENNQKLV